MTSVRAFTMPKWGIEMQEGTVEEWLIAEGDTVAKGQAVISVESDKIVDEVKIDYQSTLRLIVVPAGETRPVGALLAVFADADVSDDDVQSFAASFVAADTGTAAGASREPSADKKATPAEEADFAGAASPRATAFAQAQGLDLSTVTGSGRGGRITYQDVVQASRPAGKAELKGPLPLPESSGYASPMAVRLAAQHGVALDGLTGTGPRGRIAKADVLKAAGVQPSAAANGSEETPDVRPMNSMRRTIAKRLTEAKQTIPHYYLRVDLALDKLLAKRADENAHREHPASLNDYLIHAVGQVLVKHPDVNVQVHGNDIHHFKGAHVAMAIATERGLYAPVLRSVETMNIDEVARTSRALVAKAKANNLGADEMKGGACTVSNLGMFGIDQFDAVINPPQGAILAVGSTRRVWAEIDGEGRFETRMHVSMACDHRAIDGAVGARFLEDLRAFLQGPG